jgi:peptidoglycan/LPS O-acetylase OafA/YrhL
MTAPARFYRPELDALRFLAFGLVFLRHTGSSLEGEMRAAGEIQALMADASKAGAYGVDVFFLLSAYLITELFMREKTRNGVINTPAFYARRILRIWPLYFFFIITMLALSRFTPVQFPDGAIIPMFLFYGNLWLMTHSFFSPAGILWSVSIEEQFYLLCPLAVRLLSRYSLIALSGLLILTAIVARFVLLKSATIKPDALWFCTLTRLDPIASGILVCLLLRGRVPTIGLVARGALLLAGAMCLYGAATWLHGIDHNLSLPDGMLAYPLADIGALAIFLSFLGARITWRPVVYLGQISYGLYVYHLLPLDVAKVGLLHFTGECSFWLRGAIALPITVAIAALSYAWLEAPFLRLKGRWSRANGASVGAGAGQASTQVGRK